MNKTEIDNKLFKGNRASLAAKLKPNSIIVLNSNDIMPSNADGREDHPLLWIHPLVQRAPCDD